MPPVPADVAVAAGAFLAAQGTVSPWGVFAATWVANVSSAAGMYAVARTLGRSFADSRAGRRLLSPRLLTTMERVYRRHGVWGIFFSRFLPVYRAVVPPFAGLARLSAPRAILPMAVASGLYYGFLVWLAHRVGANWERLRGLVAGMGSALGALALLVTVLLVLVLWRGRRGRRGWRGRRGGAGADPPRHDERVT